MSFSRIARQSRTLFESAGLVDPNVRPTGGFGAGLARIAGDVAAIAAPFIPAAGVIEQLISGNFPPGTPPQKLPRSITLPTPKARLGERPVTISFAEQQRLLQVFAELAQRARTNVARDAARLPPGRLISDQSGGTNLRKFIAPERSNPMAIGIEDQIRPVQELLPFQQETFTIRGSVAGLTGQTVTFTATVPDDEAWQVDHMTMFILNGDRAVVTDIVRNGANFLISRLVVGGTTTALLYHRTAGLAGNQQDYLPPELMKLYAGDLLRTSTAALLANGTVSLEMTYRQIPLPKTELVSEEAFNIVAA